MLSPIPRQTLVEQVVERLLAYIESHNLQPGASLPSEASLAERFAVSRPVVREAMKVLAGRGMVEIGNGKRAVIKPINGDPLRGFFASAMRLDRNTLNQVMEVRRALEIESARLASVRMNPAQLSDLKATVAAMRKHLHEHRRFSELDYTFHVQLARAAHNTVLYHLIESIGDTIKGMILKGLLLRESVEEMEAVQVIHEDILSALQARDNGSVVEAMARHFDAASAFINSRLISTEGDSHRPDSE